VKNAIGTENKKEKKAKKGKSSKKAKKSLSMPSFFGFLKDERFIKLSGLFLFLLSIYLFIAFVSYFISWFSWDNDDIFSNISFSRVLFDQDIVVNNITGRLGAAFSQTLIKQWFGISSFFILYSIGLISLRLMTSYKLLAIKRAIRHSIFATVWISITLGFFFSGPKASIFGGIFGYQISGYLTGLLGKPGTIIIIFFALLSFLIFAFDLINFIKGLLVSKTPEGEELHNLDDFEVDGLNIDQLAALENSKNEVKIQEPQPEEEEEITNVDDFEFELKIDDSIKEAKAEKTENDFEIEVTENETEQSIEVENTISETTIVDNNEEEDLSLSIEDTEEEVLLDENQQRSHGIDTPYDPKEDLAGFKNPGLDLLQEHSISNNITVNREELETNKNKIVETLSNYKIKIDKIKATIGPTITLYEIVPAPGIRISKIKNLEDDIAMSLAALGIRIIAPIPGRGTIGIEVPNSSPEIVSMKTIIASEKFQNSDYDLPVAIGKTISNETFVFDLAKMPHLLVAGATGQGKSVGLNAIITSLLYKKHPAQLKFVMVDPKKVEFSLFSKIEKHYLAKLPDRADAIITDNSDVVTTLNSLCIEMDERYDLLKLARAKNLKEYNTKFIARKLNPENGHRYMPFIVLIVDEFADLIMTAGKEVEMPIARLAQLARAIGIHLIIATQRPSVNVITGMIKANFPARIAFRVTSKIDSRTILDAGGADQLIGRGDMLFSKGDGLTRLQCAFVDTPEVEEIVDFIADQKGYASAFNLPEFIGDEESGRSDIDMDDRDELFDDAARMIVNNQQGSTSLIQRKMKLGYNRAGRIIDQLEAAGIVGESKGSKARDVLISDIMTLEQLLEDMNARK